MYMSSLLLNEFFKTLPSDLILVPEGSPFVWTPLLSLKEKLTSLPLGQIDIEIPKNVIIDNPSQVSIGRGTIIEPGVYIKGPCLIGSNCTLRQGAYIREHVVTGNNCLIGHDTEVKHSVLFDGVKAAHFAYIGDSIIGCNVNVGAGVICANFRFDNSEVFVYANGEKIETGLKKLGSIISDNVQIGCNAVLNPGTLVGANSYIYPTVNASGTIEENTVLKNNNSVSKAIAKDL